MSIREGKCPECGSTEVRFKSTKSQEIKISWFIGPVTFVTYVCVDCGAVRTYIENRWMLGKIGEKWDKVESR
jgi:uncharacterized Zn finger protein